MMGGPTQEYSMRVSIWQQFSSNHSGGFEVVGEFASPAAAQEAAETLRYMLILIENFRQGASKDQDHIPVTWPEQEFSKQYGVEWSQYSIDWIEYWGGENINVQVFDQFVFVSNFNIDNTWLGASPIPDLIAKLGGVASKGGELTSPDVIAFEITAMAPDIKVLDQICAELVPYFELLQNERLPDTVPWSNYSLAPYYGGAYYGIVTKNGKELQLKNLTFGPSLGFEFPAFLAYLKGHGFTNIQYSVNARNMDDVYKKG
jgi:hypothetical protein